MLPQETECDFCNELRGTRDHLYAEILTDEGFDPLAPDCSRILMKRGNLSLLVSLGEIEPGHLIVCPSYHATAFNRIEKDDKLALKEILDFVSQSFFRHFGRRPIYFEHGDPTGLNPSGANCVHHAHLHILPQPLDLTTNSPSFLKRIASAYLHELPSEVYEPYVLVANQDQKATLYKDESLPRQFLRRRYCEESGLTNRWHWVAAIKLAETLETVGEMRRILGVSVDDE